jgi:hypothetical protein
VRGEEEETGGDGGVEGVGDSDAACNYENLKYRFDYSEI